MKRLILISVIITLFLTSCKKDESNPVAPEKQNLKIAVFSDPHYFSPSLGTSGKAFENYLLKDRKLIAESKAIVESLINSLLQEKPDVVLVPGDLTKDGELVSHQEFAGYLKKLEAAGINVFVVPGNHDVNNMEAMSYSGDIATKISTVSAEDFAKNYNDFGYGEAIARDANSLSYVAKLKSDLWILGIDACRYKDNKTHSVTGGKISDATLTWIKGRLEEAKSKNITVMAMMHHGMVEHFQGQKSIPFSSEYVIDDWSKISKELNDLGLKVVFTGHYHANDIVKFTNGTSALYDIETGSTVTFPNPYRIINYESKKLTISTKYVTNINYDLKGSSFAAYAEKYLSDGMRILIKYTLMNDYKLSDTQAGVMAPTMAGAFKVHYSGDEKITSTDVQTFIQNLMSSPDATTKFFGTSIYSLYTDLPPQDNNVVIDF